MSDDDSPPSYSTVVSPSPIDLRPFVSSNAPIITIPVSDSMPDPESKELLQEDIKKMNSYIELFQKLKLLTAHKSILQGTIITLISKKLLPTYIQPPSISATV